LHRKISVDQQIPHSPGGSCASRDLACGRRIL
jgi:hypothetical protein